MHARLAETLKNLTEEEARVVWEALGQYTENLGDSVELYEDPEEARKEKVAAAILNQMNAAMAALA